MATTSHGYVIGVTVWRVTYTLTGTRDPISGPYARAHVLPLVAGPSDTTSARVRTARFLNI